MVAWKGTRQNAAVGSEVARRTKRVQGRGSRWIAAQHLQRKVVKLKLHRLRGGSKHFVENGGTRHTNAELYCCFPVYLRLLHVFETYLLLDLCFSPGQALKQNMDRIHEKVEELSDS